MGRLDSVLQKSIRNKSLTSELLTTSEKNLAEILKEISPQELNESLDYLDKSRLFSQRYQR
jgi:DNA-binding MurR/RpiR family transcriptional regulator